MMEEMKTKAVLHRMLHHNMKPKIILFLCLQLHGLILRKGGGLYIRER